jgi:bifunctional non-homologous end joining protein LigD
MSGLPRLCKTISNAGTMTASCTTPSTCCTDGHDTRPAPLIQRKHALQCVLVECASTVARVIYSEHFEDGADLFARATDFGLEGIVSKRADAPYRSGRGGQWLKVKCWKRDRFAVIGFVPEGLSGLLKLRLARRAGNTLTDVGRVGTGWNREMARDIRGSLEPLGGMRTAPA